MSEDHVLFHAFGVEVILRDGNHFVRFDGGGIVSKLVEAPVTAEQAERVRKSSEDAYAVLIETQAAR